MGGTAPGEADCRDWEMKNWFRSSALPKSVVAFGKVWQGLYRSGISTGFCLSKLRSRVCNRGRLQLGSSGFPAGRSLVTKRPPACSEQRAILLFWGGMRRRFLLAGICPMLLDSASVRHTNILLNNMSFGIGLEKVGHVFQGNIYRSVDVDIMWPAFRARLIFQDFWFCRRESLVLRACPWKKHQQRRQNASIFFDKHVLQLTESDQSKFCVSTTLCGKSIRKERSALQPY